MDRQRKIGMGLVLLGASLWGSSSNCMEYLMNHQHFTWSTILFARMLLTGIIFLGVSWVQKEDLLAILRKDGWTFLKFSVLGMYIMQDMFIMAIHDSTAATATVLQYLMPAVLLGMYLWQEKRKPYRKEVVAVVLAIVGTALIATKGHGASLAISPAPWSTASSAPLAWPGTPFMRRTCSSATAAFCCWAGGAYSMP